MFNKLINTGLSTIILLVSMIITQNFTMFDNKTMGYEEKRSEIISDEIAVVKEVIIEEKVPDGVGTGTFEKPLEGRFTSGFGDRWGSFHGGIDIAAPTGTQITAADNGTVVFAKTCGTYGLLIKLDHNNGYMTYYAHCSEILKKVGDKVFKGDVIALVGSTGRSTGPHCHFEVRYDNERKNPLNYITL